MQNIMIYGMESGIPKLLDLMCGTGSHILGLSGKGYRKIVGVDASREMVKYRFPLSSEVSEGGIKIINRAKGMTYDENAHIVTFDAEGNCKTRDHRTDKQDNEICK